MYNSRINYAINADIPYPINIAESRFNNNTTNFINSLIREKNMSYKVIPLKRTASVIIPEEKKEKNQSNNMMNVWRNNK